MKKSTENRLEKLETAAGVNAPLHVLTFRPDPPKPAEYLVVETGKCYKGQIPPEVIEGKEVIYLNTLCGVSYDDI
jgi:hypothetical protein